MPTTNARRLDRDPGATTQIARSGVALFDEWLGAHASGVHLVTGGPGSGKSTIALGFADTALRAGDPVAMLVHARRSDVMAHAALLGIDLTLPLRDGRLMLLRYRADFAQRAARAIASEEVVADLERIIAPHAPARVVIDTFTPFVAGPPPLTPIVTALAAWLERSSGSTMLTFPEDLTGGHDRSLEPLVHGATTVARLVHEGGNLRRAELVTRRAAPPDAPITRFMVGVP